MPYLGNTPAEAYTSFDKQTITGNGGTSYTLDHAVGNEQEIEVFVNNVRQEPSVAYTVSGTSLTMTGNVESSDDFYVVFQGKATQTATHPETFDLKAVNGTFSGDVIVDGKLTSTSNGDITIEPNGTGTIVLSHGASGVSPNYSEVFIEDDNHAELTFATPNNKQGRINFTDPDANNQGRLIYDHADNSLAIHTNGSERMRIDSNGVVTRSVIPAWRLTAVHDDRTASGSTSVEWSNTTDSESADNRRFLLGGCTLGGTSPTNHEITVPVTGLYQVNVNMRVDEVGSGYVFMVVQVNNSNVIDAYSIEGSPSGSYQTLTISEVIYIRANDTVQVQVGTNSDTSYEIDGNSTFSGALIG